MFINKNTNLVTVYPTPADATALSLDGQITYVYGADTSGYVNTIGEAFVVNQVTGSATSTPSTVKVITATLAGNVFFLSCSTDTILYKLNLNDNSTQEVVADNVTTSDWLLTDTTNSTYSDYYWQPSSVTTVTNNNQLCVKLTSDTAATSSRKNYHGNHFTIKSPSP